MKRVLIMEDNVSLAFEWKDTFELNGYEVTLSSNGEEAWTHLDHKPYDLVVTDMFVGRGKGGLHLIGKIATMKGVKPHIIAVTGASNTVRSDQDMNYFLEQARRLGATTSIEKPFGAAELVSLASNILD
jgi:CheY-like chemotaxis protein